MIENSNLYGSCPSLATLAEYETNGISSAGYDSPYPLKPRSYLKSSAKFRPLSLSSSFNGTPQMSLADASHFNQQRLSRSQNFASYKSSSSNNNSNQSAHNLLISALSSIQGFTEEHQHKLLSIDRDSKKMAIDAIHSHNPADYTTMCLN